MEIVLQSSISWADDNYLMLWDKVIDWGDSTPDEIWEKDVDLQHGRWLCCCYAYVSCVGIHRPGREPFSCCSSSSAIMISEDKLMLQVKQSDTKSASLHLKICC